MSRLDDFLSHYIEDYLFYDIRFMQRDDDTGRGVGFPLLMTCCAGIEFLGALSNNSSFQEYGAGKKYFAKYWKSYLYPKPSPHNGRHKAVYQLVRNGIAHSCFTKGNIGVVRKKPQYHFAIDPSTNLLLIDAVQLGEDLINSYLLSVKPILNDPAQKTKKANMEIRLNEMEKMFANQANKLAVTSSANSFPTTTGQQGPSGPITRSAAAGGGSGPTGPV
jgi:hypothetical protein